MKLPGLPWVVIGVAVVATAAILILRLEGYDDAAPMVLASALAASGVYAAVAVYTRKP